MSEGLAHPPAPQDSNAAILLRYLRERSLDRGMFPVPYTAKQLAHRLRWDLARVSRALLRSGDVRSQDRIGRRCHITMAFILSVK